MNGTPINVYPGVVEMCIPGPAYCQQFFSTE